MRNNFYKSKKIIHKNKICEFFLIDKYRMQYKQIRLKYFEKYFIYLNIKKY
jgi:hypothetical protein